MMEWFKKLAGDKTIQHDKYLKYAENTKYDYSDYNVEGIDSSHEFHPPPSTTIEIHGTFICLLSIKTFGRCD